MNPPPFPFNPTDDEPRGVRLSVGSYTPVRYVVLHYECWSLFLEVFEKSNPSANLKPGTVHLPLSKVVTLIEDKSQIYKH